MTEKIKFKNVLIQEVETSAHLLSRISRKRGIDKERLQYMLRYNIITVKQLSELTGTSISYIERRTKPTIIVDRKDGEVIVREPVLTVVYPFFSVEGLGFKFVLRDESCEKFLKSFYLKDVTN